MGWIKCSDRMPEKGEDVLVWHKHGFHMMATYGKVKNPSTYQIEWALRNGAGVIEATHWQPLPEGPQK